MIVVQLATGNVLLLILQRYYFESESQQNDARMIPITRCCLSYKDTILKANHSAPGSPLPASLAVAYPTKILFWKRITARKVEGWKWLKLLLILQRYYFESESQRMIQGEVPVPRCCLSYKDTILKANHSACTISSFRLCAVAYPTKILFWKRITASKPANPAQPALLLILQRYYLLSES